MACACEKRKKALLAKRAKKLQQGKTTQAAAIGAAIVIAETTGKVLGLGENHGKRTDPIAE